MGQQLIATCFGCDNQPQMHCTFCANFDAVDTDAWHPFCFVTHLPPVTRKDFSRASSSPSPVFTTSVLVATNLLSVVERPRPGASAPLLSMSSTTLVLGHFANLKLAGDRVVRDAIISMQAKDPSLSTSSAMRTFFTASPSSSRRRRRRRGPRFSTRVNTMSDADLEAELVARRASRARERERYAKSMRSEKLSLLEGELARLRSEISRLDHGAPARPGGTPPNARWESLTRGTSRHAPAQRPRSPSLGVGATAPRPPPGPPPPPGGGGDVEALDPERQRREKAERQKRREQKRREREAANKPMTLADIIKAAGPDPARRLQPSGSIAVPDINEIREGKEAEKGEAFGVLINSLKKVVPDGGKDGVKEGKDAAEGKGEVARDIKGEEAKDLRGEKAKKMKSGGATDAKEAKSDSDVEKAGGAIDDGEDGAANEAPKEQQPSQASTEQKPEPGQDQYGEKNGLKPAGAKKDETEKVPRREPPPPQETARASEEINSGPKADVAGKVTIAVGENATSPKPDSKEMAAADAMAALSALASSLPPKKANSTTAKKAPTRMSLAEKRRLRRASSTTNSGNNAAAQDTLEKTESKEQQKIELADVLAAANALKLD